MRRFPVPAGVASRWAEPHRPKRHFYTNPMTIASIRIVTNNIIKNASDLYCYGNRMLHRNGAVRFFPAMRGIALPLTSYLTPAMKHPVVSRARVRLFRTYCWMLLLLSKSVMLASEQPDFDERAAAWRGARLDAMEAARAGDLAGMQQRLVTAVAALGSARAADVELAEELAGVSFNLEETGDWDPARQVSQLAREALERLQQGRDDEVAVRAGLIEAALWERVDYDRESARAAYQRVLQRAPENEEARDGLARLDLFDAMTAEKIKEQEQLRAQRVAVEAAQQR